MVARGPLAAALGAALALAVSPAVASAADAEKDKDRSWKQKAEGSRAGLELDVWSTGASTSVSWALAGQIEVIDHLHFSLNVPFTYLEWFPAGGVFEGNQLVFGNPSVGAHWTKVEDKLLAYWCGGFVTVPTQVGESPIISDEIAFDATGHTARRFAVQSRAFLDLNRFFPEYVFAGGRGGAELRLRPGLYARFDVAAAVAIPASRMAPGSGLMFQAFAELEGRADFGLGAGGRLQGAFYGFEQNDEDFGQTALEPYLVYWPERGLYARAGALVALDNVLGPGLDKNKVRTITTAIGGAW
jgi:hypothetical protein